MRKKLFMRFSTLILIGSVLCSAAPPAFAQESGSPDPHAADRVVLRKLLADIETAINENEIARLLPYLVDNVVITHQNAHVARGKQEVLSYNAKMTKGADAPIRKLTTKATVGGPAYFHGGDVAIAYGTALDQIELNSGQEFALNVAWSAALIKQDNAWKAAAIHFSTNLLDNAVLRKTRGMIGWGVAGGALLGLAIGWLLGREKTAGPHKLDRPVRIMTLPADTATKFVPEALTHLYHTSCYAKLSEPQRLQYNRLFGLRINEQFIQFEEVFIRGLMPRLKRHRHLKNNARMLAAIDSVLQDEEQHSRMFARFNRSARADLYQRSCCPFTRLSTVERNVLRILLAMPGLLPGLLWLLLAMEELTTAISGELLSHAQSNQLDPAFLALHRRHLEDEKRHVGIDLSLVTEIQEHTSRPVRRANARLFRAALHSILEPRRSTVRATRQLARDEPGLARLVPAMIAEITALEPGKAFPANLMEAGKLPVLYRLFARYPDYQPPAPKQTAAV